MSDRIERALAAFYPDWAVIVERFPSTATQSRQRMSAALAAADATVTHGHRIGSGFDMITVNPARLGQGAVGETVRL